MIVIRPFYNDCKDEIEVDLGCDVDDVNSQTDDIFNNKERREERTLLVILHSNCEFYERVQFDSPEPVTAVNYSERHNIVC